MVLLELTSNRSERFPVNFHNLTRGKFQ